MNIKDESRTAEKEESEVIVDENEVGVVDQVAVVDGGKEGIMKKKVLIAGTVLLVAIVLGGCSASSKEEVKPEVTEKPKVEKSNAGSFDEAKRDLEDRVSGLSREVIEAKDERDAWVRSDRYDPASDSLDIARRVVVDEKLGRLEREKETVQEQLAALGSVVVLSENDADLSEVREHVEKKK